jgi:membrane fusion protein (multidrug efflux system)
MNTHHENNHEVQFADGEDRRDLRVTSTAMEPHIWLDPEGRRQEADSSDQPQAPKQDIVGDHTRRIELTGGPGREHRNPGGSLGFKRKTRRILLGLLLVLGAGAVAPFAWNYLQSYESTDDAQIDGHIDPISSRVDGTAIRVHVEDDDRVSKGELLVEIDPRDFEVAVEQATARRELAFAQIASAKQDYAAALANIREGEAANFRSQRDAQRYAILLDKQVVPQEQYDQYTAIARVDAAKVDSAREAAGSALKAIAARQADADAAQAALDQALLNLSYTKIFAPANGIAGKRSVELSSRIQPGQTLMFLTETDDIWVTANFKETQLARMHRSQKVTVRVDTFGRNYLGHVENMPRASGDRFSLLPRRTRPAIT